MRVTLPPDGVDRVPVLDRVGDLLDRDRDVCHAQVNPQGKDPSPVVGGMSSPPVVVRPFPGPDL